MDATDLLLHPVRLRIVHALPVGRTRTTAQISAALPDVPKTTVYRHVALLAEAGLLEVAGEQRVRGAVERTYRLRPERAAIDADDAAGMTTEDHRRGFTAAMAALLAEFSAYLDTGRADPLADSVGYRQAVLSLTPEEAADLAADLRAVLTRHAQRTVRAPEDPRRRPHLLSLILFPTRPSAQAAEEPRRPGEGDAGAGPPREAEEDPPAR
ncbi:helix-turn-helix domain-containing protein [Streptomonospora sp. S1-112]|uniref:Helix-turn-helix domain-containing protein n=1 Tax=Streptomonospora mangrovi TaxID=2883123 RepID=A0A9X3SD35_9ACTN|nr:helix-turn-helix domain-containing protein [Streptomonospora mangrovi]MDA0563427.1 helix-turn-helix domain-containing protein [Streptomonospora mangrovi]